MNKNLYSALQDFYKECNAVVKDGRNPFHKSKYVTLDQLLRTVQPALEKSGLLIQQWLDSGEAFQMILHTTLVHIETGEHINSLVPIIVEPSSRMQKDVKSHLDTYISGLCIKTKSPPDPLIIKEYMAHSEDKFIDPQNIVAMITYMRRAAIKTILGLPEEDDDGNTASRKLSANPKDKKLVKENSNLITEAQGKDLQVAVEEAGLSREEYFALIESHGYKRTKDIPAGVKFLEIMTEITGIKGE